MAGADYPDNDPIPQLSVVTPGAGAVGPGGTTTIITPPAGKSVRLWTGNLYARHTDQFNPDFIALVAGGHTVLNLEIGACPTNQAYNADSIALNFGGIVLPVGADVEVTAGTSAGMAGAGVITYSITP